MRMQVFRVLNIGSTTHVEDWIRVVLVSNEQTQMYVCTLKNLFWQRSGYIAAQS